MDRKVVHVELTKPYGGRTHYYFGSVSAIYDTLPAEVLGISLKSIWSSPRIENSSFRNKKVTIRFDVLRTKKSNRGQKQFERNKNGRH